MKSWQTFNSFSSRIVSGALFISVISIVSIMIIATIDVITTKFLNFPIPGASELIEDLNIPLVYLGMAYVHLKTGHISGAVFERKFSNLINKIIRITGYILGVIVSLLITWRASCLMQIMIVNGQTKEGRLSYLLWPFVLIIVISFSLLLFSYVLTFIKEISETRSTKVT